MKEPLLDGSSSFLLKRFNRFYREVLALRRRLIAKDHPLAEEALPTEGDDSANRYAEPLFRQLAFYTREIGELEDTLNRRLYREAQYVMVALADEVFLNFDWPGRDYWREHLLEEQLFHSQHAGEWFFRKLDELLLQTDHAYSDLAKVYLMALAMGFQGKYRGRNTEKPRSYLRRTYEFVFQRQAAIDNPVMFPQTYSATLDQGKAEYLAGSKRTKYVVLIAALVLFGLNQFLWIKLAQPLNRVTKNIIEHPIVNASNPTQTDIQDNVP